jgi:formylglycine-generating enzyme required for sulfatase activity
MNRLLIKKISLLTLICFFSLLLADAYPLAAGQAEDGLALIAKGEADYGNGLYQDALAAFNQALAVVQKGDDRERLLLDISLVHYALKDNDSCREALRSLLQLNPERQIDMRRLPDGFVQLYGQVNWQVQEANAERVKLEEQKRVAAAAPGAFEKSQSQARFKKKKFPWLWVLLGVGVATAAILLLTKKKKPSVQYALTVTLGAGVSGTPAAGTTSHDSGALVDYNYTPGAGYSSVEVKLDGNVVAASGSVTMDQDHALAVTARNANYDYDVNVLGINWIPIPAGDFRMGDNFEFGETRERPVHTVNLTAYAISKFEVTFAQYDVFCDETSRTKPSDRGWGRGTMPVIYVSWNDAKAFCDWLATKTGKAIHLPTEAQWERAAAGTDQRLYPWGSATPSCAYANYNPCGGKTKPVGSSPAGASAVGAQDMAANAWEWCSDWFGETYYQTCFDQGTVRNPQGPTDGIDRVLRSGSYTVKTERLRCSFRDYNSPGYTAPSVSFRIAWEQ